MVQISLRRLQNRLRGGRSSLAGAWRGRSSCSPPKADDDKNESNPFGKVRSFNLSMDWETLFNKLVCPSVTRLLQLIKLSERQPRRLCQSERELQSRDYKTHRKWEMSLGMTGSRNGNGYIRKGEWKCWGSSRLAYLRIQISTGRGFATASHICRALRHTYRERTEVYRSPQVCTLLPGSLINPIIKLWTLPPRYVPRLIQGPKSTTAVLALATGCHCRLNTVHHLMRPEKDNKHTFLLKLLLLSDGVAHKEKECADPSCLRHFKTTNHWHIVQTQHLTMHNEAFG